MIAPLYERVLLRLRSTTTTKSGLFVPESAHETLSWADVLAVGSGRLNADGQAVPLTVKPGDVVLFTRALATATSDGTLLILERDILGIENDK